MGSSGRSLPAQKYHALIAACQAVHQYKHDKEFKASQFRFLLVPSSNPPLEQLLTLSISPCPVCLTSRTKPRPIPLAINLTLQAIPTRLQQIQEAPPVATVALLR